MEFTSYGGEWPKLFYVDGDVCKKPIELIDSKGNVSMSIERVCE
jgi:hypothetical protein